MAIDARNHQAPAAGEQPQRSVFDALSLTVNDVVYCASAAGQATFASAMSTAGYPASATNPLVTWRADAAGLHHIESSVDGTNWMPASGVLHFTTTTARDSWTTTNSAQLSYGDRCIVASNTVCQWNGSAWVDQTNPTNITTFGTGYTAGASPLNPRVKRVGNIVFATGVCVFGTGSGYGNVCTVPAGFAPATTGLQKFATSMGPTSNAYSVELAIDNTGLIQIVATSGTPASGNHIILSGYWFAD